MIHLYNHDTSTTVKIENISITPKRYLAHFLSILRIHCCIYTLISPLFWLPGAWGVPRPGNRFEPQLQPTSAPETQLIPFCRSGNSGCHLFLKCDWKAHLHKFLWLIVCFITWSILILSMSPPTLPFSPSCHMFSV